MVRAFMRWEAKLLVDEADARSVGILIDRTDDQRRHDAFLELLKEVVKTAGLTVSGPGR